MTNPVSTRNSSQKTVSSASYDRSDLGEEFRGRTRTTDGAVISCDRGTASKELFANDPGFVGLGQLTKQSHDSDRECFCPVSQNLRERWHRAAPLQLAARA